MSNKSTRPRGFDCDYGGAARNQAIKGADSEEDFLSSSLISQLIDRDPRVGRIFYGISIAFAIRSFDPSRFAHIALLWSAGSWCIAHAIDMSLRWSEEVGAFLVLLTCHSSGVRRLADISC